VGEAADLAVGPGGLLEVEIGEGMRLHGVGADAEVPEQMLADQVRHAARGLADAEVDAGLAEIDGQQLGVAVGHVHERHVAEGREVVEAGGRIAGQHLLAIEREAGGGSGGQYLQEFPAGHRHGISLLGVDERPPRTALPGTAAIVESAVSLSRRRNRA